MRRRGFLIGRLLKLSAALSAVLFLAAGAVYLRLYGKPDDLFNPRALSPQDIRDLTRELYKGVADANNDLVDGKKTVLAIEDRRINAFLWQDGPNLFAQIPPEISDYQVAFRPDKFVIRFRYADPQWESVHVGLHIRVDRGADGSYGFSLDEMTVGNQNVPRSLIEPRLKKMFPELNAPTEGEGDGSQATPAPAPDAGNLREFMQPKRARAMVGLALAGKRFGPLLPMKIWPTDRSKGAVPKVIRIRDWRFEHGRTVLELEPEAAPATKPAQAV